MEFGKYEILGNPESNCAEWIYVLKKQTKKKQKKQKKKHCSTAQPTHAPMSVFLCHAGLHIAAGILCSAVLL